MLRVNSLAPGKFEWNFRYLIFQIIAVTDGWVISCEHALRWMSLDLTDDKSTLVQVMAWCRQATSHYLSHCWPRSLSPYGVTRPQWVNCIKAVLLTARFSGRFNGHFIRMFRILITLKCLKITEWGYTGVTHCPASAVEVWIITYDVTWASWCLNSPEHDRLSNS